jgi:hypothetical protein
MVCPKRLDERHRGVANDPTDASELTTRLDHYVAGNDRALAVVRLPTEAEEQNRPERGSPKRRASPRNRRTGGLPHT